MTRGLATLAAGLVLGWAATALAGAPAADGAARNASPRQPAGSDYLTHAYFGPNGDNTISLPAIVGVPAGTFGITARRVDGHTVYCTLDCVLHYSVELPSGALITGIGATVNDGDGSGQVTLDLQSCGFNGSNTCSSPGNYYSETGPANTPGASTLGVELDGSVDVSVNSLSLVVGLTGATSATSVRNVMLSWRRQISPAPGSATFADVTTGHAFFQEIEALAASGVTSGCAAGAYCPNGLVTRGQMAAFLARALGL